MPFLQPNQQRQSTEGTSTEGNSVNQYLDRKYVEETLKTRIAINAGDHLHYKTMLEIV